MAPRFLIFFKIAMGADYSFYVKSIATFAPTFYGYIISILASVLELFQWRRVFVPWNQPLAEIMLK